MIADPGDHPPIGDSDRVTAARGQLLQDCYAPLWSAARRRLESNGLALAGTPITVSAVVDAQREAICGLLGRSSAGDRPIKIGLAELDAILRRGAAGIGLVEIVEAAGGPVVDRRAARTAGRDERERSWQAVERHPALVAHPELHDWVQKMRGGPATRIAGSPVLGAQLVSSALDVADRLPAPTVTLAALAAEMTGDAHALDRDQPLGKVVAGLLVHLDVEEADADDQVDASAGARWWRRRWAHQGVVCDDLSVSALVLNLPVRSGGDIVANMVAEHALAGEPLRLTFRQLAIGELIVAEPRTVYVCENPSVVAQAGQLLEDRSAPLVCVEGQPNSAAAAVLDLLVAQGCELRYHGDFDWGGIRIANGVMARFGATPWRYGTDDYQNAHQLGRVELSDQPAGLDASWDRNLVPRMVHGGVAIYEEQVLGSLLHDLANDGH